MVIFMENDEILYCIKMRDIGDTPDLVFELLSALDLYCSGFEDRENRCYHHTVYALTSEERDEAYELIQSKLPEWSEFEVELDEFEKFDLRKSEWADAWKKFFKPLEISDRLLVRPSWETAEVKPGQKVLTIDPGMCFGTGQHATTLYCLEAIDKLAGREDVKTMLDAGCGSGILAIAAAILGYSEIDAYDFDPDTVRMTEENLAINNITTVKPTVGDAANYKGRTGGYDLVCANILGHLLKAFRNSIAANVRDGGYLALAGILNEEFDGVAQAFTEIGFKELERKSRKEWTSGLFIKE